jgi:hypothetical protein
MAKRCGAKTRTWETVPVSSGEGPPSLPNAVTQSGI